MKVCITTDAWTPVWGGGQEHIWQVANILARDSDYSIDIFVPNLLDNDGRERNREESHYDNRLRVLRLGPSFKFPSMIGRFLFLASLFRFQVLHQYDIYNSHASDVVLFPLVKLIHSDSKFVYTIHGKGVNMLGLGAMNRLKLLPLIWRLLVEKYPFDGVISAAWKTLPSKLAAKEVIVVGNGVNAEEYDQVKSSQKKRGFKIIWVGRRDDPIKGVAVLEKAYGIIRKKYPQVTLEIVTNKFGKEKIKEYKSSDLFVLPSLSEGLPLVLLEAMAARLPVITTDVGDCRELVEKAKAGIIVPPNNVEAIASGIEKMIKENGRMKMGENGHNYVKKHYTWTKIARKTNEVFQELAKR